MKDSNFCELRVSPGDGVFYLLAHIGPVWNSRLLGLFLDLLIFALLDPNLLTLDVALDGVGDPGREQLSLVSFLLIAHLGDCEVGENGDDRKDDYQHA